MIVPRKVHKKLNKKDKKYLEKTNIAYDVYIEAKYYYHAAKLLEEKREPEKLFPPVIMNAAFSCELFSKAILRYCNIELGKEHSLINMYNKFPQGIKEQLKKTYKNGTENRFEAWIVDIAEMFEFWRYRFEHKEYSSPYSFVLEYMELLNIIAEKIFDNNV